MPRRSLIVTFFDLETDQIYRLRESHIKPYVRHKYAYILNQRNIGMIAACDILIAIYNGDATGGTANGVRDGRRLGKWIVTIPPTDI